MNTGDKRPSLSHLRGTGFHPHDPDYTVGLGREIAAAARQARMDIAMQRKVWMEDNSETNNG